VLRGARDVERVHGVGRGLELVEVRRDHGRAAIDREVAPLRIDDRRDAGRAGGLDRVARDLGRDDALGVVGQHERLRAADPLVDRAAERVGGDAGHRLPRLAIDAHDLLLLRDEARLLARRSIRIGDRAVLDVALRELRAEDAGGVVGADHADERGHAAERADVGGGVRRAAERPVVGADLEHRHRRLGRDPRHVAAQVLVEHDVTDDEHAAAAELVDHVPEHGRRSDGAHRKRW
jgi:hypothetical protein